MTEASDPALTTREAAPESPAARGDDGGRDDVDVLGRMASGDLAALETLYDRHKSVAYAIALRITADTTLAEDVVQDAFLGTCRNASRYASDRGSVRTWLLSIVHHRAIDALRRRRITTALPEGDEPLPPTMTLPDVWAEVAGRLDADTVRSALARLSEVQREALELAYWSGLTQQEIAAQTSTLPGTVKSRMRLGLLALRRDLGEGRGEGPSGTGVPAESSAIDPASGPGSSVRGHLSMVAHAVAWCAGLLEQAAAVGAAEGRT